MKRDGKTDRRSLKEDGKLIWRALGIIREIIPGFWTYHFFCTLLGNFAPYFGLYLSAEMVNELAGECEVSRLLTLAGITVVGEFLLAVVRRLLETERALRENRAWERHEAFMLDAQNGFPYEHMENPEVILAHSKIRERMTASAAGVFMVKWVVSGVFDHVLNLIFSVSLTVSMFTMAAEGTFSGLFGFVNSPASAVVIIGLVFLNSVFSVKISAVREARMDAALDGLAEDNTRLFAYNALWGTDMFIFDLNRIVLDEMRKTMLRPKWVAKREKISIRYGSFSAVLEVLLNLAIFLFVAAKAYIGVFGIGKFILYQGTVSRFVEAVSGLASAAGRLRNNNQYLIQLYDYLDMSNDMYQGTLAVEKRDDIDYEIEFRDVSFKYPRTDTWVLRHVSMKFKIGKKLAIVGENGSGKTTLIKLLCRLYDPTEGKILLNGIDITRYRYDEYLALFSVVFQDFALFGFPLGENVAASSNYDEGKVRDCLIRAGLGDKLAQLDNDPDAKERDALKRAIGRDYDSEGIDFSGGEKQKIAMARALYKDAPFVVLDEPTAALDPIAEAAVYENVNRMVKDKTAVFISHRLSSCRFCDDIAVFDHGQLVQLGAHEALVEDEGGKYSRLWHAQAQYYAKS